MNMVIKCETCKARFHLDMSLLKGARGIRVRCRKCGGFIVVLNPDVRPDSAVAMEPSLISEDRVKADMDVSGVVRPEFVPGSEPQARTGVEAQPYIPASEPVLEQEPARSAISTVEIPGTLPVGGFPAGSPPFEGNTADETAMPEPDRGVLTIRTPSLLSILIISVLWIVLLAGGALYFGTKGQGQGRFGGLFREGGGSAGKTPVFEIRDVQQYTVKGSGGEMLCVIRGTVANVGRDHGSGIRIQVTVPGKDNHELVIGTAVAGNLLDNTALRKMSRAGIGGFLNWEGRVDREIPRGHSLPFMVVIYGPPEPFESFTVKVTDVYEQGKIHTVTENAPDVSLTEKRTIKLR